MDGSSRDAVVGDGAGSSDAVAVRDGATLMDARPLSADAAVLSTVAACAAGDGDVAVSLERETIDSECEDEFRSCYVSLGIRVTNCTSRPIALRGASASNASGGGIEWTFELFAIAPGETGVTRSRYFDEREEEHPIEVFVVDESGEREWRWRGRYRTVNPARRRALAACQECRGIWRQWGIRQTEGCNCRTSDAGRACEDGRDCEGLCEPTGTREVSAAVRPRCECPAGCRCSGRPRRRPDGSIEALCGQLCTSGRPAMLVSVGRCSEFRMNFGCRNFIPDGARDEGPRPAGWHRSSHRCAD